MDAAGMVWIPEGLCPQRSPTPGSEPFFASCEAQSALSRKHVPHRRGPGLPVSPVSRQEAPREEAELLSGCSRPRSLQNWSLREQGAHRRPSPENQAGWCWDPEVTSTARSRLMSSSPGAVREGGRGPRERHRRHPPHVRTHTCTHVVACGHRDPHTHVHAHPDVQKLPLGDPHPVPSSRKPSLLKCPVTSLFRGRQISPSPSVSTSYISTERLEHTRCRCGRPVNEVRLAASFLGEGGGT